MLRRPTRRALPAAVATVLGLLAATAVAALPAVAGTPDPRPASGPAALAAAAPTRVMPLGDSITGSPGCWRAMLWNSLTAAGHTDIDFVGTLGPQGCGVPYDGDNEGHGGALVTTVANQNQLPSWLSATRPDIVLMHFGTNDAWSNVPTATIIAAYDKLVDQMRASNPAMTVLVAQLIPMAPPTCGECGQRVVALNAAIPAWAAAKSRAGSPVVVVDQWTGFSTATDTYDGVHPNAAGDRRIADRWLPALTAALGGVTPTTPPPTTPPPTTPPPTTPPPTTPPPVGGCTATHRIVNQWQGGFQGEVTVRAGTASIGGWTVRFSYAGAEQVTQAWNATVTQTGRAVTAGNVGWNGSLNPGTSVTFGYLGTGTPAATPAATCTSP
ncbi:cellulose binding domain-containing protein [Polymorphospora sp. NPDC051019]|uniref:cellulose binding domain-containing protein n=1 Tax=Polymorphospora sp. NPDC051019 TaxID=3155725 RepID=UPI00341FF044